MTQTPPNIRPPNVERSWQEAFKLTLHEFSLTPLDSNGDWGFALVVLDRQVASSDKKFVYNRNVAAVRCNMQSCLA